MPLSNPLRLRSVLLRASIPLGGALVLSCEATGPRGPAPVSLSIAPLPAAMTVGTGANSLKITRVEFVLAETQMAHVATRDPLQLDPMLIDLPLGAAAPRKVTTASVPAGRYTALATRLRAVGSEGGFRNLHPDWPSGVSVRVAGVYTDASGVTHDFTFTSATDAQIQIAFARPITVDAPRNVTLAANVARWFRSGQGGGAVMDPRNSANAAAINANIRGSFKAFQDDDENGVEDEPGEIDDDETEVEDDDTTDVEDDDTTDVEDDTTDVEPSTISLLFKPRAARTR